MTKHDCHRWAPRARAGRGVRSDDGATLMELLVNLGIMSLVMAVATGALVQMYRTSNRGESMSIEIGQLQTAFQLLDKSVRYATGISQPNTIATAGGSWYVEWASGTNGELCTQMRLDPSGRLQRRELPSTAATPSGWTTMASSLAGTQPFVLEPASASTYPHQRLTVNLEARAPGQDGHTGRRSVFTFTALNTSLTTSSAGVCSGMVRS
ncbi:hypothetical protein AB0J80_26695 [Actinoplanes sp. NPDC049548]|uniref:PulJ/GspJ family protein n=1 Tax=Actinoplanes sp. NPDC049548 TaxID=3155152 RepID=UPI0034213E46